MADDGAQHRQRDVVGAAHAHALHHQVVEHIDAGAHLGHAVQVLRRQRGGRAAHADHRAGQAGFAQALRGAHAAAALLLGHGLQGFRGAAVVAGAGVGHHAGERGAAVVQRAAHVQQQRRFGQHTGAVAVGVDLDQHLEAVARGLDVRHQRLRGVQRVHHHLQRAALFAQGLGLCQLGGRDAHRVQDVGDAGLEEHLCFFQRGHRDALRPGRQLLLRHGQTLGRLHVRPQARAQRRHALLHVPDVVLHAGFVQQRGGGGQLGQGGGGVHAADASGLAGFAAARWRSPAPARPR